MKRIVAVLLCLIFLSTTASAESIQTDTEGFESYQIGSFSYRVPIGWEYKESTFEETHYHTTDNENVFYAVSLYNGPNDNAVSALDRLQKMFPDTRIDFFNDDAFGFIASGTTTGGMQMVKACIFDRLAYLEITYNHYGVDLETQYQEFEELFQYVELNK